MKKIAVSFRVEKALKRSLNEYCRTHETGSTAVILKALETQKVTIPEGYQPQKRFRALQEPSKPYVWLRCAIPCSTHHSLQDRQIETGLSATNILLKGLAKLGIVASMQE